MKYGIIAFLMFALTPAATAQVERPEDDDYDFTKPDKREKKDEKPDKKPKRSSSFIDKARFGGGFGLTFGTVTAVEVSPRIMYPLYKESLYLGVGGMYLYYRHNDFNVDFSIYGGSIFTRYFPFEKLFLHGEFEMLSVEDFRQAAGRTWVPGLYAGAGYRLVIGRRAFATVSIMYNLTYDQNLSPYSSPLVPRFAFFF